MSWAPRRSILRTGTTAMLRSANTGAALEPLRTRFQTVARQVTGGLGAISARVYELPEVRRPALLALLLKLESRQLQLRQFVEQVPLGHGADPRPLESAIRQQLDLLAEVTTLAERGGLIERKAPVPQPRPIAATGSSVAPAYHNEFATALDRLAHAPEVAPLHSAPADPGEYRHGSNAGAAWPPPLPQTAGGYPPHAFPNAGLPAPPYYALPPHPAAYQHLPPGYYMP